MTTPNDFDQFLARELNKARPQCPDEGFTDGVMAALPAKTPARRYSWRDRLLVALPVLVVGALVLSQLPLGETVEQMWQWYFTADAMTLFKTGAGIFGGLLLACFAWLAREMELL